MAPPRKKHYKTYSSNPKLQIPTKTAYRHIQGNITAPSIPIPSSSSEPISSSSSAPTPASSFEPIPSSSSEQLQKNIQIENQILIHMVQQRKASLKT